MIDVLKLMYPYASPTELTQISNFCVFLGWFLICLGFFSTIIESIYQKKVFYEGFPLILFGLFFIILMGIHSDISFFNNYYCIQFLIPMR